MFEPDLVICSLQVNATEDSGTLSLIKHVIYAWQRISSFYSAFVEGPAVNAHALTACLLLDEQHRDDRMDCYKGECNPFQATQQFVFAVLQLQNR